MLTLVRTDAGNPDFAALVQQLDADLAARDGAEHSFYAPFNTIDAIKHAVVAYEQDVPVGCGAIKQVAGVTMEVKRMYTLPDYRGKGLAARVLAELERWALELGNDTCVLETGKRQPEAIRLYQRCGYTVTPNYGQYVGVDNSVCFAKRLKFVGIPDEL